jgi:hypothetical protein
MWVNRQNWGLNRQYRRVNRLCGNGKQEGVRKRREGECQYNVAKLRKGNREGCPYKCLNVRHIRRGDLHGRPYTEGGK